MLQSNFYDAQYTQSSPRKFNSQLNNNDGLEMETPDWLENLVEEQPVAAIVTPQITKDGAGFFKRLSRFFGLA